MRETFEQAGIPWADRDHEDRGDGMFILVGPDVPKSLFAESLPSALVAALHGHNAAHPDSERIRLRMALHAGEVNYDEHGATAAAINLTFRLLEAGPVKEALAGSSGVLAVITSSWFFEEVVRHSAVDVAAYRSVPVTVKETSTTGWICLPDDKHGLGQMTPQRLSAQDAAAESGGRARVVGAPVSYGLEVFKDRHAELKQILRWLDDPATRMITVFGRRGIGKSALAAKAVEMVARGNTGFSGVVNLSTRTDGTLTIERIFFACAELASPGRRNELNILWASQRDPRDKLTELFTVLEEGRIVVVLDNIEDQLSDDGRPGSSDLGVFFDVIFRAEKAPRVLVTTQVPVVLDPAVLRMHARLELKEGLPVAECVELLRELDRNGEAGLMDSLRYWVLEMHVDGFRFARAAALARQFYEVDRLSAFFDLVQQDPVVSQVKLIAEPWNVGDAGYRVGNFPPLWSEWNGNYRDTVRDFWRGRPATLPEFTFRLTGSSDLYQQDSRRPVASVNFVTCHDGFTLTDLVSYDRKHNQANGEYGRDGSNDNRSWNCGAEGPTDDPDILVLRERQKRNFLATLLLSQGVPMLLAGDEMGRTQRGNNNAYCQDNEISWVDWAAADEPPAAGVPARRRGPTGQRANQALLEFVRWLVRFRADHPVFRRRRFFHGQDIRGVPGQLRDIAWFTPAGQEMTAADWQAGSARSLTVFLNGRAISEPDRRGERIRDDSFLLLFNASELDQRFTLPPPRYGARWSKILDTAVPPISAQDVAVVKPGDVIGVPSRSVQVLCRN